MQEHDTYLSSPQRPSSRVLGSFPTVDGVERVRSESVRHKKDQPLGRRRPVGGVLGRHAMLHMRPEVDVEYGEEEQAVDDQGETRTSLAHLRFSGS